MDELLKIHKLKIYWHIAIFDNEWTRYIIRDQLNTLKKSKIYDYVDSINCGVASDRADLIDEVAKLLKNAGFKFIIRQIAIGREGDCTDWATSERLTYEILGKDVIADFGQGNNDLYFYLHTKGVSRRHHGNVHVLNWRKMMEYYLITHAELFLKFLEMYDIMGIYEHPGKDHYAGNFWWARGDYLYKLFTTIKSVNPDWWGIEFYLYRMNPKALNLHPHSHFLYTQSDPVPSIDELALKAKQIELSLTPKHSTLSQINTRTDEGTGV